MDTELLLDIQGMSVEFPGIKALDSVDFTLRKGEIVALLGENGAGKSPLIKALTGVYRRSAGEIFLEGNAIDPLNTAHAQSLGIGTVYQEVNLLPNLSVAANLFLGREPLRFGMIDQKEMARLAREIIAYYGLRIDVTDPLGNYSIAIQQIIAIARAVDLSAKVLILDEPTASLDANEVDMLFGILSHLREHGVGMIFVTHFLDQVYRLSDRITVLRNGKLVGSEMTAALPRIDLVQMMLGHSFDESLLKLSAHATETGDPLVEFRGYGRRNMVDLFDLSVAPGEIIGLAGLLGSGRTETAQLVFGIKTPDSGEARVDGQSVSIRSPRKAGKLGFGYCPEDRKTEGIVGSATVRENIILVLQAQSGWLRPLALKEQTRIAEMFIERLGIRTPSPEQEIQYLSGGNQQKVLLSRWLATEPSFLILDEPTRGIDVGAHAEIIRLIEKLCERGMALLVISSELEELTGYADRIIVLRDRKQVAHLAHQEISVAAVMQAIALQPGGAHDKPVRRVRFCVSKGLPQIAALVVILLIDSLVAPNVFSLHMQDGRLFGTLIDILNRGAPVALLALGMTLVIATGGIDLSVGAVMAIAGATAASLAAQGHTLPVILLTAVLTGAVCGLWNGFLVAVLQIQPIVATLMLMVAGRGVAQLITEGQIITFAHPVLAHLGSGSLFYLPMPVIIACAMLLLLWLLTRKTALGLFIEAVGINVRSARKAGISTRLILISVYVICGICAAVAGVIITADIRGADVNNAGLWLELDAILAVVIGGGSLLGGRFNLLLAVVGALIIQSMNTGILLAGYRPELNLVLKELVVLAVLIMQSPRFSLRCLLRRHE